MFVPIWHTNMCNPLVCALGGRYALVNATHYFAQRNKQLNFERRCNANYSQRGTSVEYEPTKTVLDGSAVNVRKQVLAVKWLAVAGKMSKNAENCYNFGHFALFCVAI